MDAIVNAPVSSDEHRALGQDRLRGSIDGHTRLVGVIGWPVSHTRSPAMHNAAFIALGLNYVYVPMAVRPDLLQAAIGGLAALGFVGVNVTVPYKEAVLSLLHELTPAARFVGAANTIAIRADGSLLGHNTDVDGFTDDLMSHGVSLPLQPASPALSRGAPAAGRLSRDPSDHSVKRALLLGAGGAARAVAYALAHAGVHVAVVNRTTEKAEALCRSVATSLGFASSPAAGGPTAHHFPEALSELAPAADLIVNATSLGLNGPGDALPWDRSVPFRAGQIVYDLVYTGQTPFLQLAAAHGAKAISGLGMLAYQGARAFELWTGQPAPVDVMLAAISG